MVRSTQVPGERTTLETVLGIKVPSGDQTQSQSDCNAIVQIEPVFQVEPPTAWPSAERILDPIFAVLNGVRYREPVTNVLACSHEI